MAYDRGWRGNRECENPTCPLVGRKQNSCAFITSPLGHYANPRESSRTPLNPLENASICADALEGMPRGYLGITWFCAGIFAFAPLALLTEVGEQGMGLKGSRQHVGSLHEQHCQAGTAGSNLQPTTADTRMIARVLLRGQSLGSTDFARATSGGRVEALVQ